MPIDYQQIYTKIQELGKGLRERRQTLEKRRADVWELMNAFNLDLDLLNSLVDSARQADPSVRCARPMDEALLSAHPKPDTVTQATLIAADGSQILPDRHAAIQYYVINVGAIAMQIGSGSSPQIFTETELHVLDEFEDTIFSESQIALQRDVAERKKLLEVAQRYPAPILAITEGQLELWGTADLNNSRDFEKTLGDYLDALKDMRDLNIVTSGYVDKPGANWVVRLLEITTVPKDELRNIKKHHPFLGVTDRWLFEKVLGQYERSAIFALQAKSAEKYTDSIAIHFFYLNVGEKDKPVIVRVDIPLWVVENKEALDMLHCALIEQTQIMSHKPFPYILHRAHETAVVSMREKEQVDQLLALAIRNNGGEMGEISGKQSAKNLPGRTRW
ncbi:MAG: DNA double-strand break repair nuclease NurA [Anaerolineales bacterium]